MSLLLRMELWVRLLTCPVILPSFQNVFPSRAKYSAYCSGGDIKQPVLKHTHLLV